MGTHRRAVEQPNGAVSEPGKGSPPASGGSASASRDFIDASKPGVRAGVVAGPKSDARDFLGKGANPGAGNADHQPAPGSKAGSESKPASKGKVEGKKTQVHVEAPEVLTGTAEAPESPPGKTRGRPKKAPKIDGKMAARGMLDFVEIFTVGILGPEAAFSANEARNIEEPLGRMIERYGSALGQYSALMDPILLLTGLGMYAYRVDALYAERRAKQAEKPREAEIVREVKLQDFEETMAAAGYQPEHIAPAPAPNGDPSNPTANVDPLIASMVGGVYRDR
jgi:hypothetical protein